MKEIAFCLYLIVSGSPVGPINVMYGKGGMLVADFPGSLHFDTQDTLDGIQFQFDGCGGSINEPRR